MKVAEPLVLVQLAKLLNNLTNQINKTHPLKDGFFVVFTMCYINSMLDKSTKPINEYRTPSMVMRLGAAAIDLAIYILLSFIILTVGGLIIGQEGTPFRSANNTISDHIKYSKLAKDDGDNGYVAYTNTELLSLNDANQSLIIEKVSYFYCSYLTGVEVDKNLFPSLDKDEQIKVKNDYYLPKDYYTVSFFNEEVLGLTKEGEIGENRFFIYTQNAGQNDYTKVGTIKPEFIEEISSGSSSVKRLKNDTELTKELNQIYNDAIKVFYNQKSIKKANDTINTTNAILMLFSTMPSFIVFYLVLPLISPFGQTLGKRILSIGVTDDKGYLVKKWRMLLRSIPILGATIYVCLINSLYYQLLIPLVLLLISMGFLVFTPSRRCLHDLMSGTAVIKLEKKTIIYEDEAHYEQALQIMKERDKQDE